MIAEWYHRWIKLFAIVLGICIFAIPIALAGDPWTLWSVELSLHQQMIGTFTLILGPLVATAIIMVLQAPLPPQPPRGRKSHPAVSFGQSSTPTITKSEPEGSLLIAPQLLCPLVEADSF